MKLPQLGVIQITFFFNNKAFIVLSFNFILLTGYVAMTEKRHGLATLTFNKLVVCSQKHKWWVLVVLVRMSGIL